METFGPVRSRRFGMSLGINHLPPKVCSYACVYCQLGRTHPLTIQPAAYSQPEEVFQAVQARLGELDAQPDYLTFVSNGEPTLDSNLGLSIDALKPLNIPTAVISNASLLGSTDVRSQLMQADTVSLKVDAIEESAWRKINRPHGRLAIEQMLEGIRVFAHEFTGRLLTESMLTQGVNDTPAQVKRIAEFIASIQPEMAYLSLPLRAPAEDWVQAPSDENVIQLHQIFMNIFPRTALMADLPEANLPGSDDPLHTLIETLKVHPLPQAEVLAYLAKNRLPVDTLEELIAQKEVRASVYKGKTFYAANYEPQMNADY